MAIKIQYWLNGKWTYLDVDNADNLDWRDSTDFASVGHKHFKSDIVDIPGNATTAQDGFMSVADKVKLNGIAAGANNYTYVHPNDSGTRHVNDTEKANWNGKANANHTHPIANITGLQGEIDNLKSSVNHTHTIASITGLQGEIDSLKSSASNGKNVIASAITAKGIPATGSEEFATLGAKIGQIKSITAVKSTSATTSFALGGGLSGHVTDMPNVFSLYRFCKMTIQITTTGPVLVSVQGTDNSTSVFKKTIDAGSHSLVYCFNSMNRPYTGPSSGGFSLVNKHTSTVNGSYTFHYSYVDLDYVL